MVDDVMVSVLRMADAVQQHAKLQDDAIAQACGVSNDLARALRAALAFERVTTDIFLEYMGSLAIRITLLESVAKAQGVTLPSTRDLTVH